MPYILKAADCPLCTHLHPETIIAWRTELPPEEDERTWSIVGTIEEVDAEYEKVAVVIETTKKETQKKQQDEQLKLKAAEAEAKAAEDIQSPEDKEMAEKLALFEKLKAELQK